MILSYEECSFYFERFATFVQSNNNNKSKFARIISWELYQEMISNFVSPEKRTLALFQQKLADKRNSNRNGRMF